MKRIKSIITSVMIMLGIVALPAVPAFAAPVTACDGTPAQCAQQGFTSVGGQNSGSDDLQKNIKIIVNVLLFVLGAIAVIMIIIGGIRYTTSNGDASATKGAKDTILYAVIGLIVAILAYAIVNFVLGAFK